MTTPITDKTTKIVAGVWGTVPGERLGSIPIPNGP
jgi:hypothetical protein